MTNETIHPAAALELEVENTFASLQTEITVGELKQKLTSGIRTATSDVGEQAGYVEGQIPGYLRDVFSNTTNSALVKDPDHFKSDAVGLLQLSFPRLYGQD